MEALIEFIKIRQLNFAVAALLTCCYLVYQYWGMLFKVKPVQLEECPHSMHKLDRPRSRSRSRTNYREDIKHGRGRRSYGRCPDCSKCQECNK